MTPDWEKIKAQYIQGGESYTALARQWGVGQRALAVRGRDEGWPQLRAAHKRGGAASDTPMHEPAPTTAADADRATAQNPAPVANPLLSCEAASMARIEAVTDLLLEKAERLLYEDVDAQTIQRLASAIKTIKETKGLRTEPDAREQEAKIKGMELKNKAEDEVDNTIIVQLGEAAKYAV